MIEPTDISIPPVMMTTVMPSAMIPMGAKLRVMLASVVDRSETWLGHRHAEIENQECDTYPERLARIDALQQGHFLNLHDFGNDGVIFLRHRCCGVMRHGSLL